MTESSPADPARLAGLSLIAVVVGTVLLEFFGIGSIGDARIKIILSSAAILLLGNEVRQLANGGSSTQSKSGGNSND